MAFLNVGGQTAQPTGSNTMEAAESIRNSLPKTAHREEPCTYCPNCSSRLESRRCKLMCWICGYYMSCAYYY